MAQGVLLPLTCQTAYFLAYRTTCSLTWEFACQSLYQILQWTLISLPCQAHIPLLQ
jgi:hypothetical protein